LLVYYILDDHGYFRLFRQPYNLFTILNTSNLSIRYRAEIFTPPYISANTRPQITSFKGQTTLNTSPIKVTYGEAVPIIYTLTGTPGTITATIVHPGFRTHSQAMSMRLVHLQITDIASSGQDTYTAKVYMPPNNFILPPGPHYVFILNNGTPCTKSVWVLVG